MSYGPKSDSYSTATTTTTSSLPPALLPLSPSRSYHTL